MVQWIVDNWIAITSVFGAALVLAKVIVKLTPTKTDDDVVDRIEAMEKTLEELFKKSPSIAPTEAIVKVTTVAK